MVRFVHRPFKEVVVGEYVEYPTPEALATVAALAIRAGQPFAFNWAEGVVFAFTPLHPETDQLLADFLKGKVYWSSCVFAIMPSYLPAVKVGAFDVPVIDASPNQVLRKGALWLKSRRTKKRTTPSETER